MIDAAEERKIQIKLEAKKSIWINSEDLYDGELVRKEFFLRKTPSGYSIGFDQYLDKYEDATDLYMKYVREDFDNLTEAVEFCISELAISTSELLNA